uniref:Uncharacterized protein n=1 Tax=Aegilops tauschii subsp. strangulata TaxID=200361 RepID=A0A452YXR5_AEGTS
FPPPPLPRAAVSLPSLTAPHFHRAKERRRGESLGASGRRIPRRRRRRRRRSAQDRSSPRLKWGTRGSRPWRLMGSSGKKSPPLCRTASTPITSESTTESSSHMVISSSGLHTEMMQSILDVISHTLGVGSFRLHWRMTSICGFSPLIVQLNWRLLSRRSALSRLILDLSTA